MYFAPAKTPKDIHIDHMSSDKSISHRAAIIAAMSDVSTQPTRIKEYLQSEDTFATVNALRKLGVDAEFDDNNDLLVHGVGLHGIQNDAVIDVGNSGTLMRLLTGWLIGQKGRKFVLDGDESIRSRPMNRIIEPLNEMCINGGITSNNGYAPLTIIGGDLKGIRYTSTINSSQVKSAILLASLMADSPTLININRLTRSHTEDLLCKSGVSLSIRPHAILSEGRAEALHFPKTFSVPNDISSAAFLMTAAVLTNKNFYFKNVSSDIARLGFIKWLTAIGRPVFHNHLPTRSRIMNIDLDQKFCAQSLQASKITTDITPSLIDELPLVALIACFAKGRTQVTGASELRFKESDRISAIVEELSELGADIEELEDGFVVNGKGYLEGGEMDSRGDHRIAMMGAIAGLASEEGVKVKNFDAYKVSYPTFLDDLEEFGLINS